MLLNLCSSLLRQLIQHLMRVTQHLLRLLNLCSKLLLRPVNLCNRLLRMHQLRLLNVPLHTAPGDRN